MDFRPPSILSLGLLLIGVFGCRPVPAAACFEQAAAQYRVPVKLLKAIALQESSGRANAVNRNANGTFDVGLMQINTAWLPTLARHGIQGHHLFDPCVSTMVGAWILSNNFAKLGYTVQGLGAYNAVSPHKRERYARQVLQRLPQVAATKTHGAGPAIQR